jgi:hypothetical protein
MRFVGDTSGFKMDRKPVVHSRYQQKAKPPEKAVSFFRSVLSGLLGEIFYTIIFNLPELF